MTDSRRGHYEDVVVAARNYRERRATRKYGYGSTYRAHK